MQIPFINTYVKLPDAFFQRTEPSAAVEPQLIAFNAPLAAELGIESAEATDAELAAVFSGKQLLPGSEPLAMVYAGHQFGNFVPQLGDGRAILLGEVVNRSGQQIDLQLKGAGATRFSRGGDGRAALGPVLREYIVSEAMHALGVPTTRSLAAVLSGGPVYRDQALPGAILTRVAASHLRVGTFEYFASRGQTEHLRQLADYAIARHYPDLAQGPNTYLAFFEIVARRQLRLVCKWMSIGFIHGVMNTDNTTISGETIDYGPCAFMDHFRANKVFSSIDRSGRYAYNQQGNIMLWNLANLGSCLVPLIDEDSDKAAKKLEQAFQPLPDFFRKTYFETMGRKLGLADPQPEDSALVESFFSHLAEKNADFTNAFRALTEQRDESGSFFDAWRKRLDQQDQSWEESVQLMRSVNPARIPRNHQIEKAITAAEETGDFSKFAALREALADPYTDDARFLEFTAPPTPEEEVKQTFCGT